MNNITGIKTTIGLLIVGGFLGNANASVPHYDTYDSCVFCVRNKCKENENIDSINESINLEIQNLDDNKITNAVQEKKDPKTILRKFIGSIVNDNVSMDGDFRKFIDDNFWDLV